MPKYKFQFNVTVKKTQEHTTEALDRDTAMARAITMFNQENKAELDEYTTVEVIDCNE